MTSHDLNMFRFYLELEDFAASGFAALDFRRKFGLFDGDTVHASTQHQVLRRFDVGEAFARAWFGYNLTDTASVDVAWLVPGELLAVEHGGVALAEDIAPDRARELYVRARFAKMEARAAEMEAEADVEADHDDES